MYAHTHIYIYIYTYISRVGSSVLLSQDLLKHAPPLRVWLQGMEGVSWAAAAWTCTERPFESFQTLRCHHGTFYKTNKELWKKTWSMFWGVQPSISSSEELSMSPKFLCPMVTWITWGRPGTVKRNQDYPVTPSKFQRSPNRAPSVQSRIVHGWIVPAREVIKRVLLVVDANKLILTVSNTSSFVGRKTNCLSNLSKGVNMCQPVSLSCPGLLQDLLYRLHGWRRRWYSFHGGIHSTRHLEQSRSRLT